MIAIKNLLFQPLTLQLAGEGQGLHLGPRERREICEEHVSAELKTAAGRGLVTLTQVAEPPKARRKAAAALAQIGKIDPAEADDDPQYRFPAGSTLSIIALYNTIGDPVRYKAFWTGIGDLGNRLGARYGDADWFRQAVIYAQGEAGLTAIHHAMGADLPDHLIALLDAGANVLEIRDSDGMTAPELALIMERTSPLAYAVLNDRELIPELRKSGGGDWWR